MRKNRLCVIFLVSLAVSIFSGISNVTAEEEEFTAMVIDTNGSETKVHNLYLSYHKKVGGYVYREYFDSAKSMRVIIGETQITIPFANITEMEFNWAENENDKSTVTITTLSGKKIEGEPGYVSFWSFKGKTDIEDFKLDVDKIKKVVLSHEIASLSQALTPTSSYTSTLITVTDASGSETEVHDLYLYYKKGGMISYVKSENSIQIKMGEGKLTIPFTNITEIVFGLAETEEEKSNVTITTLDGEKIKGEPSRVSHWSFKGKTDFGNFKLKVNDTKKIHFSHEISSTSIPTSSLRQKSTALIDTSGFETNVYDLCLYYRTKGIIISKKSKNDMLVRKGENKSTIPFSEIIEIEFAWDETNDENSTVTITKLSGEKIKGEPCRISNWYFKGKTDFGDFKLGVDKTKKVIIKQPSSSLPGQPGFDALFAIVGLLGVIYIMRRRA